MSKHRNNPHTPYVKDRTQPRTRQRVCRKKSCNGRGFGGWCYLHTPSRGAGVVKCFTCGDPVAEHSLGDLPCRGKGGLFEY